MNYRFFLQRQRCGNLIMYTEITLTQSGTFSVPTELFLVELEIGRKPRSRVSLLHQKVEISTYPQVTKSIDYLCRLWSRLDSSITIQCRNLRDFRDDLPLRTRCTLTVSSDKNWIVFIKVYQVGCTDKRTESLNPNFNVFRETQSSQEGMKGCRGRRNFIL